MHRSESYRETTAAAAGGVGRPRLPRGRPMERRRGGIVGGVAKPAARALMGGVRKPGRPTLYQETGATNVINITPECRGTEA
eukprot:351806-Chlamydomonas_euryale.AAC.7